MPLGCVVQANYHKEVILYTVVPLVVIGSMLALSAILNQRRFYRFEFLSEKIFGAALLLSFLILPTMSMKIFSSFACRQFDRGYGSFLKVDFSINCASPEHISFLYYASLMVVIYPVGIPLTYYLLLRQQRDLLDPGQAALVVEHLGNEKGGLDEAIRRRDALEKLHPKLKRLRFLYGAYEPRCGAWFEVFETLRKIALTGGLIFFNQGSASQIVVSMILCLGSMRVYAG